MPHRKHRNANAAPPQPRRKRAVKRHEDWVTGTLVVLDADAQRLVLRVKEARRAATHEGEELTVMVSDAVLKAADGDGDGRPGLTDLFPGDELHLTLAPAAGGQPATATRVRQSSPGGPVGGLRRLWANRRTV